MFYQWNDKVEVYAIFFQSDYICLFTFSEMRILLMTAKSYIQL